MTYKVRKRTLLTIRMVLAIVFLLSGIGKLIDSGYVNYDLIRLLSTKFYWLIEYAAPVVITLSVIELLLALLFFWGKKLRWTLGTALILLISFTGILGYYYLQGMQVASCGCFGAFGIGGGFLISIIKNLVLIGMIIGAYFLVSKKRRRVRRYGRSLVK